MNTYALEDDTSEPNVGRCVQIQATRIDAAGPNAPAAFAKGERLATYY
jgi:hypothetical protein